MIAAHAGQAPPDVARAAAKMAAKWAARPETSLIARAELERFAPSSTAPDMAGTWVPRALYDWGRGLTFWREPAGEGTPGELVFGLPWVIANGGGDCDDVAAAQAAMAKALGLQAAVGLVWPIAGDRSRAHVFAAVSEDWSSGPRWLVIDAQQPEPSDARLWRNLARWFKV